MSRYNAMSHCYTEAKQQIRPATRGPTLCPLSKFSWWSLPAVLVAAVSLKQIAQILRFRVGGSAQQRLNVEDFL